jgi:hypothetical protein
MGCLKGQQACRGKDISLGVAEKKASLFLEHVVFETLHSAWPAKKPFAYASWARPTLTLSAVRAISK